ncbi:MAG: hypothetical protein R2715_04960 [Ilumatobacteraceae bacterium]
MHLGQPEVVAAKTAEAHDALDVARQALMPHPAIYHAGFFHDAAKEYVEAVATQALVARMAIPGPDELGVEVPAYLNGLAEAASELRRHALDRLRDGEGGLQRRGTARADGCGVRRAGRDRSPRRHHRRAAPDPRCPACGDRTDSG